MNMQPLSETYLVDLARQLAFLGAFLGGFAATFLATLLLVAPARRLAGWVVGSSAFAACSFVVTVVASVTMTTVLHPEAPRRVAAGASADVARLVSSGSFGLGVMALLVGVGLSGWLRSRNTGIATSIMALGSLILVIWATAGFG